MLCLMMYYLKASTTTIGTRQEGFKLRQEATRSWFVKPLFSDYDGSGKVGSWMPISSKYIQEERMQER